MIFQLDFESFARYLKDEYEEEKHRRTSKDYDHEGSSSKHREVNVLRLRIRMLIERCFK